MPKNPVRREVHKAKELKDPPPVRHFGTIFFNDNDIYVGEYILGKRQVGEMKHALPSFLPQTGFIYHQFHEVPACGVHALCCFQTFCSLWLWRCPSLCSIMPNYNHSNWPRHLFIFFYLDLLRVSHAGIVVFWFLQGILWSPHFHLIGRARSVMAGVWSSVTMANAMRESGRMACERGLECSRVPIHSVRTLPRNEGSELRNNICKLYLLLQSAWAVGHTCIPAPFKSF